MELVFGAVIANDQMPVAAVSCLHDNEGRSLVIEADDLVHSTEAPPSRSSLLWASVGAAVPEGE